MLGEARICPGELGAKVPGGGEQKQHVVAQPLFLAQLEDGLASADIIPAVVIDEDDPAKIVLQKIVGEPVEQIEIETRRGGERAGELEVMMRIAEPHQRRKEHLGFERGGGAPDHFTKEQAVGKY